MYVPPNFRVQAGIYTLAAAHEYIVRHLRIKPTKEEPEVP